MCIRDSGISEYVNVLLAIIQVESGGTAEDVMQSSESLGSVSYTHLILLSLLGTVAHATGLVDDTINAENLYSKYPLSNYQLDFYVDNSCLLYTSRCV